jgi:hypothetical protein
MQVTLVEAALQVIADFHPILCTFIRFLQTFVQHPSMHVSCMSVDVAWFRCRSSSAGRAPGCCCVRLRTTGAAGAPAVAPRGIHVHSHATMLTCSAFLQRGSHRECSCRCGHQAGYHAAAERSAAASAAGRGRLLPQCKHECVSSKTLRHLGNGPDVAWRMLRCTRTDKAALRHCRCSAGQA